MDKSCVLFLLQKDTSPWEILFMTMQDLLTIPCEGAGIPAFFHATVKDWQQENVPSALRDYENVLVLEGNRPFITTKDIVDSFQIYQENRQTTTLLQDKTEQGKLTGWYPSTALKAAEQPSYAMVENLSAVTTRRQLAEASEFFRKQIIDKHLDAGVNIPLDAGVIISPLVTIEENTTILPGTIIKGKTTIGAHCEIGPNTQLTNMQVAGGCHVIASFAADSIFHENANIGPMANIRPGCTIGQGTKIGDFVELKNAKIGANTSVAHLSYLGDCTIGSGCNFGCGSTIVNYDGTNKHHTTIGDDAFIGCNCNMVAPVTLGNRVYAAAGSTITESVPDDALVIARVRQTIKEEWSKDKGLYHKK